MADRHGIDQLLGMIDELAPAEIPAEDVVVPVAPLVRHSPAVRSAKERLEALASGKALIKQFLYLREADYAIGVATTREGSVLGMLMLHGLEGEAEPDTPIVMKDGYTGERYTTTFQQMGGITVEGAKIVVMRKQYDRENKDGEPVGTESELLGISARLSNSELLGLGLVPEKTVYKFDVYRHRLFEDL